MDPTGLLTMFSVLMFQIGSRQISFDLTDAQRQLFKHPGMHFVVVLCMFYIGTRRCIWAITLVIVYYLCLRILLNEKHPYNMFSKRWLRERGYLPENLQHDTVQLYYDNLKKLPM